MLRKEFGQAQSEQLQRFIDTNLASPMVLTYFQILKTDAKDARLTTSASSSESRSIVFAHPTAILVSMPLVQHLCPLSVRSQIPTVFVHDSRLTHLENFKIVSAVSVYFGEGVGDHTVASHQATCGSQGLQAPSNDAQFLGRTATVTTSRFTHQVVRGHSWHPQCTEGPRWMTLSVFMTVVVGSVGSWTDRRRRKGVVAVSVYGGTPEHPVSIRIQQVPRSS